MKYSFCIEKFKLDFNYKSQIKHLFTKYKEFLFSFKILVNKGMRIFVEKRGVSRQLSR